MHQYYLYKKEALSFLYAIVVGILQRSAKKSSYYVPRKTEKQALACIMEVVTQSRP